MLARPAREVAREDNMPGKAAAAAAAAAGDVAGVATT